MNIEKIWGFQTMMRLFKEHDEGMFAVVKLKNRRVCGGLNKQGRIQFVFKNYSDGCIMTTPITLSFEAVRAMGVICDKLEGKK